MIKAIGYVHVNPQHHAVPAALRKKLRRADEFIKLAVTACDQLLGNEQEKIDPNGCGLFVGTAFGPMQTNFEVLDLILEEGRSSPFLFSHSVFNAAAGYLAEIFAMRGQAQTSTDFSAPFFTALREAMAAITTGRLQRCLILQVETYSPLLEDARRRADNNAEPWPAGAVAWLLEREASTARGGYELAKLRLHTMPCPPEAYLRRAEQTLLNNLALPENDPLAPARALTELIAHDKPRQAELSVSAPYCRVDLALKKII